MPTQAEMLIRGLVGLPQYPLRLLRSLPSTLPHFEEVGILDIVSSAEDAGVRRRSSAAGIDARQVSDRRRAPPSRATPHVVQRSGVSAPPDRVRQDSS